MTVKIYVPGDMASVALGADEVAGALAIEAAKRSLSIQIVRNGSRGLFTLEPLVEVETAEGRIGYGPVSPDEVPALVAAGLFEGKPHAKCVGRPEELPFFKGQTRLTFARNGITDPLDFDDYVAHGGLKGIRKALEIGPKAIVEEVLQSGLRGRGGAGFPTGIKWKTVADTTGAIIPGAEIDLVLDLPGGEVWAIEIKRSSAPTLERGFYHACEDIKPARRFVIYNGQERYPLKPETEAVGLRDFVEQLTGL